MTTNTTVAVNVINGRGVTVSTPRHPSQPNAVRVTVTRDNTEVAVWMTPAQAKTVRDGLTSALARVEETTDAQRDKAASRRYFYSALAARVADGYVPQVEADIDGAVRGDS